MCVTRRYTLRRALNQAPTGRSGATTDGLARMLETPMKARRHHRREMARCTLRSLPARGTWLAAWGGLALAAALAIGGGAPTSAQEPERATQLQAGTIEAGEDEAPLDDGLPSVALATFTTEISDREPVDQVSFLGNDKNVVYFFTDLRNLAGQEIRHVWTYNGRDMGTVRFKVDGTRWRVWSSKQLLPDWLGEWTVSVLNADDEVMATESFTYQDGV